MPRSEFPSLAFYSPSVPSCCRIITSQIDLLWISCRGVCLYPQLPPSSDRFWHHAGCIYDGCLDRWGLGGGHHKIYVTVCVSIILFKNQKPGERRSYFQICTKTFVLPHSPCSFQRSHQATLCNPVSKQTNSHVSFTKLLIRSLNSTAAFWRRIAR